MKHEILPAISGKKASNIRLLIVEIRLHFRFHFIHFVLKSNNKTIHRPARACTCTFSGFSQSKQTQLLLMSLMTLTWPFFRTLSIDKCATKSTISGREVINHFMFDPDGVYGLFTQQNATLGEYRVSLNYFLLKYSVFQNEGIRRQPVF